MARLVIGTSKAKTVPALVKEVGPVYYKEFNVNNGTLTKKTDQIIDFEGVTTIAEGAIDNLFTGSTVAPDFKNVTTIQSMVGSFQDPHFASLDMKNVTTIGDMTSCFRNTLNNASPLVNIDLGDVATITNATNAFQGVSPNSFTASNLTTIGTANYMFASWGSRKTSSWRFGILDLSSLTTITKSAQNMFASTKITKVILSGLTSAGGALDTNHNYTYSNMFNYAYTTHVDLSGITSTSAGFKMFSSSGVKYVNFKNLQSLPAPTYGGSTINDGALEQIGVSGNITVLRFPSLTSIGQYCLYNAFASANVAPQVYFYHHLDVIGNLQSMCSSRNGVIVHFPISEQAVIGSQSVVTGGFGNNTTTVLFDIVTEATGADGNTYTRQQKDSVLDNDFEPTATAWVYNNTLYYTSGSAEPAVGDNIYSDSACSIVATTVSAIA